MQGRCWPCWNRAGAGCGGGCQAKSELESALKTTQVRMGMGYARSSGHEICGKLRPSRTTSWMRPKLNSGWLRPQPWKRKKTMSWRDSSTNVPPLS